MWQLFILTFFTSEQSDFIKFDQVWSSLIKSEQVWSSLINFGQIWSKQIQNKTALVILFVNMATFYSNIFWLMRNPIWSSLIKFDPFWKIWSKKIKNQTAIFILFVNVKTFYRNTFDLWEIHFDQVWSILDRSDPKKSKTERPFLSFL